MNNHKHPDQSWLISYSAGAIGGGFALVLQAHLAVCERCRNQLLAADHVGAELMVALGETPAAIGEPRAPNVSDLAPPTDSPVEWNNPSIDISRFFDRYVGDHIDSVKWMFAGRGLKVCRLVEEGDERMWLLRAQAGTALPKHDHSGSELTLVLKGAYGCDDRIFEVGDIEDADDETTHQPIVTAAGECICVAAVEGPLCFTDWLPRLVQPFMRI
jgi:putative transcriptional regulator